MLSITWKAVLRRLLSALYDTGKKSTLILFEEFCKPWCFYESTFRSTAFKRNTSVVASACYNDRAINRLATAMPAYKLAYNTPTTPYHKSLKT